MLVLARKPNETILIGDDVRIVVVQLQAGRVRLGIEAPPEIRIRRNEIPVSGAGNDNERSRSRLLIEADLCVGGVDW